MMIALIETYFNNWGPTRSCERQFLNVIYMGLLYAAMLPTAALANSTWNGFTYTNSNGAIVIISYTGFSYANQTMTVPETIGSVPVTTIGGGAFAGVGMTNIIFGKYVTSIGDYALEDNVLLTAAYFRGNAPVGDSTIWFGDNTVTNYYLPGTTGWTQTFADDPTAVWLPRIQTGDANFGIQTNQFQFDIQWTSGQTIVVEACTNLAAPVWIPAATNTFTGDSSYFSDSSWTNYPFRFYRLRSP